MASKRATSPSSVATGATAAATRRSARRPADELLLFVEVDAPAGRRCVMCSLFACLRVWLQSVAILVQVVAQSVILFAC